MRTIKNISTIRSGGVALALLFASLAAPVAEAGWVQSANTYTYTSGNYGYIIDGENLAGEYTNSQFQTWSMTLAAPLEPYLNFAGVGSGDVGATSWTFNDGRADGNGTFDSTTGWQYISVGTDGSGSIIDWIAAFAGPRSPGSSAFGFSCGGSGCDFFKETQNSLGFPSSSENGYSWLLSDLGIDVLSLDWDDYFSSFDAGNMMVEVGYAIGYLIMSPEQTDVIWGEMDAALYGSVGPVPEPGTLALVCAGLIGTFSARRRAPQA